jgi:hypothetical protein
MDVLYLSLLALFAGPLLYLWLLRGGLVARTFEQLVVAVLVLVVGFLLVPEVLGGLGMIALLLIAAGYLVPGLLEKAITGAAKTFHLISLFLALAGLALHAMLDGAGLAGSEFGAHQNLAIAIVMHRLGVGLVLWLIVQPAFGRTAAFLVLTGVCMVTVLGFHLSETVLPLAGDDAVLVLQALIVGTIVHSLVHREHVGHRH